MTALPSLPLPVPAVATTGRNLCDSALPTDTCSRCSACLAMASVLGCVRRCLRARVAAAAAAGQCMRPRACCFFARLNRLELSAPLVETSSRYPELLGQLIDALASPHALYGHSLKLPGISLSSLHSRFLSRRVCPSWVCQFKGSFQSATNGAKTTDSRTVRCFGEMCTLNPFARR